MHMLKLFVLSLMSPSLTFTFFINFFLWAELSVIFFTFFPFGLTNSLSNLVFHSSIELLFLMIVLFIISLICSFLKVFLSIFHGVISLIAIFIYFFCFLILLNKLIKITLLGCFIIPCSFIVLVTYKVELLPKDLPYLILNLYSVGVDFSMGDLCTVSLGNFQIECYAMSFSCRALGKLLP